MLGRNLTEKPTVADVSWRLLQSAPYLVRSYLKSACGGLVPRFHAEPDDPSIL